MWINRDAFLYFLAQYQFLYFLVAKRGFFCYDVDNKNNGEMYA